MSGIGSAVSVEMDDDGDGSGPALGDEPAHAVSNNVADTIPTRLAAQRTLLRMKPR
ncbi:MAG: hypothetical protein ACJ72P_11575 [Nocardioides sp.]